MKWKESLRRKDGSEVEKLNSSGAHRKLIEDKIREEVS